MKSRVTIVFCICVSFYIDLIVALRIFRKPKVIPEPAEEEDDNPQEPTPHQLQFKHNGHSVDSMHSIQENLIEAYEHAYQYDLEGDSEYGDDLDLAIHYLGLVKNHYGALIHLRDHHPCLANMWNNTHMRGVNWMLDRTRDIPEMIDSHKENHTGDKRIMRKMAEAKKLNKKVKALVKKDMAWRKKHYPV